MDHQPLIPATMGQIECSRHSLWRRVMTYKYYVISVLERKHTCKLYLAFRVPSKRLHIDYTICDSDTLQQHALYISDAITRTDAGYMPGVTHLPIDAANMLDHYCDRRMLCILKRYHCPEDLNALTIQRRANDEIEALRRLKSKTNVVTLLDHFEYGGNTYYAMEYVWRGTLRKLIQRNRGLDIRTTKTYAYQVGSAIATMHKEGISHRDINSGNILVTSTGDIKLIDFNLCKLIEESEERMTSFLGTYSVMPPEVLRCNSRHRSSSSGNSYTKEIDWWYLGTLIYEMLACSLPFTGTGDNDEQSFYNRVSKSPDTIDFTAIKDEDAKDLIKQLLQRSPADRLGAEEGWSCISKHKFFSDAQPKLHHLSVPIDYLDSRIFEAIKALIMKHEDA